jgi:internalin A
MTDVQIIKRMSNVLRITITPTDDRVFSGRVFMSNANEEVVGLALNHVEHIEDVLSYLEDLTNLQWLIITSSQLNSVDHLSKLERLTELDLYNNNIADIKALENLRGLLRLGLCSNKITDISPLKRLDRLEVLSLTDNRVNDIKPIVGLSNVRQLFIGVNPLTDIKLLKEMKSLTHLYLGGTGKYDKYLKRWLWRETKIGDLSTVGQLTNLRSLDLSSLLLEDITFLKGLRNLEELSLRNNKIVDIEPLSELVNLRNLDLAKNEIVHLPAWITSLNSRLTIQDNIFPQNEICVYDNPIVSPPREVCEQGIEAVRDYYNQIEKEKGKIDCLYEAKLLVIGEGGTGKTTFTRKMLNLASPMPDQKDTTLGIEVSKWNFKINLPADPDPQYIDFHVNLWDFGGQKIYQGTHQIFFSDKSFYVLIADTREQKTDFSYWLNTVEQLAGENSHLIIVLNQKFGHEQKFDESGFRSHFGKLIREVVELDLKNDTSKIRVLQNAVKTALTLLPGIGDPLPPSWVSIRQDLLKEKANFISFDSFRQICARHGITDPGAIHTLSGYFNRIGAFTHYIDDSILQERIYLNSNWLVKTVYEILDNEVAKSKKGRLRDEDIKQIWGNNELRYETNKLTQLMHNFGLMYHIPLSDQYVVPAHLPTVMPYDQWEHSKEQDILQFNYEFDKYMPQGIMSRLIVSLNHHIVNHDLVWHRGVNIEANGAFAEIIESYGGSNKFELRIVGKNKIELLAIIRERFAEVLKPFGKLNYKQQVPCICTECRCSSEPAFHDYNLLLKFREKGTGSQCKKTGEIVSADELLKITEFKLPKDTAAGNKKPITIKIFLASSSELVDDRKELREFISVENDRLHEMGIYLKIVQWEYFIDAMSPNGLQTEYYHTALNCDIFLSLFCTKVGKYTADEFENAFGHFQETGRPFIYTYFKSARVNIDDITTEDIESKTKFEERLKNLNHYKTKYTDINDLKNQLKRQLDLLLPKFQNGI